MLFFADPKSKDGDEEQQNYCDVGAEKEKDGK